MTTKRKVNKAFNCPGPLVWRKGPPPSLGWWIASLTRSTSSLRWWDGETWSFSTTPDSSPRRAGLVAQKKSIYGPKFIEWLPRPDYWPERSKT